MASTTHQLAALALGSDGHPTLQNGVHLRWQSAYALGFPSWGYSIWRRLSPPEAGPVIESFLGVAPATYASPWVTPVGTWTSDVPLRVIEVVADGLGDHELALGGAASVEVALTSPAVRTQVNLHVVSGTVRVTYYCDGVAITERVAVTPGAATLMVTADRITSVRFVATNAVLRSISAWQAGTGGQWTLLAGPIGLPVTHPDYPLVHPNAPNDWTEASSRIPATEAPRFAGTPWNDLRTALIELVVASGTPMADRTRAVTGTSADGRSTPDLTYRVLAQVLQAALDPMVARMLGLLYIDGTAVLNTFYDYRIGAHHTGPGSTDYSYEVLRARRTPTPPLPAPVGVTASQASGDAPAWPGASRVARRLVEVGWKVAATDGSLHTDAGVRYRLFGQFGGTGGSPSYGAPPTLLNGSLPTVVTGTALTGRTTFVRYGVDPGWYRIRVASLDLFGRESAQSGPAEVHAVDDLPPPAPVLTGAHIVRAGEPRLTAADSTWLAANSGAVGVAVEWSWPTSLQQQAPDASSFEVLYQEGRLNAWTLAVGGVADNGDGTSDVETDLDGGASADAWNESTLAQSGRRYSVLGSTAGSSSILKVQNTVLGEVPSTGTGVLSVGPTHAAATDYSVASAWSTVAYTTSVVPAQTSYSAIIGPISIATSTLDPFKMMAISLTTTDLAGLKSRAGQAAVLPLVHREAPSDPAAPTFTVQDASRVDFHGRSFYDVPVPNSEGLSHHVFRALDTALITEDRRQRALRAGGFGYYASFTVEEYEAAGGDDPDYSAWEDADFLEVAGRTGYDSAFRRATSTAVPWDGTSVTTTSWTDTLDGRGQNLVFYRLQALDGVGNVSSLGTPGDPVRIPLASKPVTPKWRSANALPGAVALSWDVDPSRTVTYTLYRAESADDALDVRYMQAVNTIDPGEATYVATRDAGLTAGVAYVYRPVAVDTDGNRSAPSLPVTVTPAAASRPGAPAIASATWSSTADEVTLTWADTGAFSVAVQRLASSGAVWTSPSGWLVAGTTSYTDTSADPTLGYHYRLRLMDADGVGNVRFNPLYLPPRDT